MKSTAELVDMGIALRAEIAARQADLKDIEAALKARALKGEQIPLVNEEREGRQWLAKGTEKTIRVVLTADEIMASFRDASSSHLALEIVARDNLGAFYAKETVWRNIHPSGLVFRRTAADVLGPKVGSVFVAACLRRDKHGVPRSTVKVEWDNAKEDAP